MAPQRIHRAYKGNRDVASVAFQEEATIAAGDGYFPVSEQYVRGGWGIAAFVLAILACLVLVGLLPLILMLFVRPAGALTVTYESQPLQPDTPSAERVTAAAAESLATGWEGFSGSPRTSIFGPAGLERRPRGQLWIAVAALVAVIGGVIVIGTATMDRTVPPGGDVAAQSPAARWAEFSRWIGGDMQSILADLDVVSARAEAGDIPGLTASFKALKATATRLIAYMDAHPPASCYSEVHAKVTSAFGRWQDAAIAGLAGDLSSAGDELNLGDADMTTAATAADVAEKTCLP